MATHKIINPEHIKLWLERDKMKNNQSVYLQEMEDYANMKLSYCSENMVETKAFLESMKNEIQNNPSSFVSKKIKEIDSLIENTDVDIDLEIEDEENN